MISAAPPPRAALAPNRSPPPSQIVLAILGLYATVYGMVKIKGMLTSKPVPKKEAPKALASKMSGLGVSFEVKGGEGASVTSAKWGEASPARLSTAPTATFPPPPRIDDHPSCRQSSPRLRPLSRRLRVPDDGEL